MAFYVEWDWVAAEREFDRAIGLDPANPDTRMWYTDFLQSVGRMDEAVAQGRRTVELDPQNSFYSSTGLSLAALFSLRVATTRRLPCCRKY